MEMQVKIAKDENVNNLTVASAIVCFCDTSNGLLDPIKVAKAILVEKEREKNEFNSKM